MRASRLSPAALAFFFGCAPAFAGPAVGEKAPAFSAGSWINLPGSMKSLSPKDLKGQVVMLEFWATW